MLLNDRFDLAAFVKREGKVKRGQIAIATIDVTPASDAEYRRIFREELIAPARDILRKEVLPAAVNEAREIKRLQGDSVGDLNSESPVSLGDNRNTRSFAIQNLRRLLAAKTPTMIRRIERALRNEEYRHGRRFARTVSAAVGVDVAMLLDRNRVETFLLLALDRNVALINGLSEDMARRAELTIGEMILKGAGERSISKALARDLGIVKRRADFIAADQAGKWAGQLNQIRQTQAGIDRYKWRTALDERVRPLHRRREGQVFRWSQRPSDGHPGEPIMCRCSAQGIIDLD